MRGIGLAMLGVGLVAGCAERGPRPLVFGEPVEVSGGDSTSLVTASVAGSGRAIAAAWTVTPSGSENAALYVRFGAGPARVVPDSSGPAATDPETPPKIRVGADGSLDLLYGVARKVAGEPWPFSSMRFRRSVDGGQTWGPPALVSDDGEFGRYRNDHSFAIGADGTRYAAWLDQRGREITLAFARSTDQGVTWSPTIFVDPESPCECCRSAMATSDDGRVFLTWRKKLPGGIRDIVIASSADKGATWSEPVRVHADDWQIDGCPDAGPSLLADGDGGLHLAWWTGKPGAAGVKYARSPNGGKQWLEPVPLGIGQASAPAHVQLARVGPDTVMAVWEDGTLKGRPVVMAMSATNGATFTPPAPLSAEDVGAGFPTIAVSDSVVAVLWHQNGAVKGTRVLLERVAPRR